MSRADLIDIWGATRVWETRGMQRIMGVKAGHEAGISRAQFENQSIRDEN